MDFVQESIHSLVHSSTLHACAGQHGHLLNPTAQYSAPQIHHTTLNVHYIYQSIFKAAGRRGTGQGRGDGDGNGTWGTFKRRAKTHPCHDIRRPSKHVIAIFRPPPLRLSLSHSLSICVAARLLHVYQTSLVTSPPLATNDLASPSTPAIGHVNHPDVHIPIFFIALLLHWPA